MARLWESKLAVAVTAAGCAVAAVAGAGAAVHWRAVLPTAAPGSRHFPAAAVGQPHVAAPLSRPQPRHRTPRAAGAGNAKKGVSVWVFNGAGKALARSGASWYYTWAPDHPGIASPPGVHFVPMIWGAGAVTAATLRQVSRDGRYLLGFNEPDRSDQSNLTVSMALQLWPRLMATGMNLGSPAVAINAATPGGWLDRFIRGAAARHYRVNFITVHWYGGNFATGPAVQQLQSYLRAIYARYHLPIWLTEFALIRFGATASFPSPRQQAAFITAATSMLQHLAFVQRYAWFALPATPGDGSAGLFRSGTVITAAGRAFQAAGIRGQRG